MNKKNFLNLTFYEEDFGIPAKWSFSATSYGKGPWDSLAGCVKREAVLESLRRPSDNQILTTNDFYEFAKSKFCEIHIDFIPTNYIEEDGESLLKDRFILAKTIKGTLGFHSFTPIAGSRSHLIVKRYDLATEEKCVKVVI